MSSSTAVPVPFGRSRPRDGKRLFFASICLILLIPASVGSAVFSWSRSQSSEALFALGCAAVLGSAWLTLRHSSFPRRSLRPYLAVLLALGFFQIAAIHGHGYAFTSLYILPMVSFFLFGYREGVGWSLGTALIAIALMIQAGTDAYPFSLVIRFSFSFAISAALAFEIELLRNLFVQRLTTERQDLEATLDDIKTLQGFLPICASCKSIRDDRGFWSSLDHYLSRHSRAEITPALCPSCLAPPSTNNSDGSALAETGTTIEPSGTGDTARTNAGDRAPDTEDIGPKGSLRRRRYLTICLGSTALMGLIFGIPEALWGVPTAAAVELFVSLVCLAGMTRLGQPSSLEAICQIFTVTLFGLLGFELYVGGSSGQAFLWSLVMPPILFALLGRRQGLAWSFLLLLLHLAVFFAPSAHPYPPGVALRISVVLLLVTLVALGSEISRERLRLQLQREKSELQQALDHAETLHGILPICPKCKNIRDDDGFWRQVEDYLAQQAGTQLSHGLCPSCSRHALDRLNQMA